VELHGVRRALGVGPDRVDESRGVVDKRDGWYGELTHGFLLTEGYRVTVPL
jgi:hypothetical protein